MLRSLTIHTWSEVAPPPAWAATVAVVPKSATGLPPKVNAKSLTSTFVTFSEKLISMRSMALPVDAASATRAGVVS